MQLTRGRRTGAQSQDNDSPGGGAACIDLLNRMWDCETKRRITCKEVIAGVRLEAGEGGGRRPARAARGARGAVESDGAACAPVIV